MTLSYFQLTQVRRSEIVCASKRYLFQQLSKWSKTMTKCKILLTRYHFNNFRHDCFGRGTALPVSGKDHTLLLRDCQQELFPVFLDSAQCYFNMYSFSIVSDVRKLRRLIS